MSTVCTGSKFESHAAEIEFELSYCCLLSSFSFAESTGHKFGQERRMENNTVVSVMNDDSMIQAAHVSVGINRFEGMQAVMASDFAVAQFHSLVDLLLIHGRRSYLRICKVVLYFSYKNLTFTLTQFWFTFHTGLSGQRSMRCL